MQLQYHLRPRMTLCPWAKRKKKKKKKKKSWKEQEQPL
jgi:hypothetical protein